MTNVGYAAWSLPRQFSPSALPDAMLMHVGIQTLRQMRNLGACRADDERALRQCLRCNDSRQKISAIGLNLVENFRLSSDAGNKFRAEFFDLFLHVIEVAAFLEVPAVYIPSFNKNEISSMRDLAETASFFKTLCRSIRGYPIVIASENSLSAEQQLALVGRVGEPNFRVLLDIFNPLRWGHSVEDIVSLVHPYLLNQVHIKDGILPAYGNALLGQGDGNVVGMVEHIVRLGFCDTYILENNYSSLFMSGLDADIAFLRSCLSGTQGDDKKVAIDA